MEGLGAWCGRIRAAGVGACEGFSVPCGQGRGVVRGAPGDCCYIQGQGDSDGVMQGRGGYCNWATGYTEEVRKLSKNVNLLRVMESTIRG